MAERLTNPAQQNHGLRGLQNQLLRLLGNPIEARADIVQRMLRRDANEAVSYWLQLSVSVGIATLGLVVGSAAVVIGAMLIAPLMGPIIALAMGLAAGSPFLVLRSGGRIVLSVTLALSGAAAITVLLPFHELNAEISARTAPTVLDLLTAGFCAVAGVYATLRPGSDTTATAAGTSIGISLVPPLCASGYGLGTLAWPVAGGAALLFLTNLVAIVAVGTVAFVASGFNGIPVLELEREVLATGADAPFARWMASKLSRVFGSKLGPVLRFLMPFVLLAAVYVPLRRALDEVAWEVRARKAVREAIEQEPGRVVQSRSQVARHAIDVVVVVLGKAQDAEAARARLRKRVQSASGIEPSIEVLAVPDATAFAGLESTMLTPHKVAVQTAPSAVPLEAISLHQRAESALKQVWPTESAGEILDLALARAQDDVLKLEVLHFGRALERGAQEALEKSVSQSLAGPVAIETVAVPPEPITREQGDLRFIARVASTLQAVRHSRVVSSCLTRPETGDGKPPLSEKHRSLAEALDPLLSRQPRVTSVPGETFELRLTRQSCSADKPRSSPKDASVEDAAKTR